MSKKDFELVRGSGNVFRDMGFPEADILQAKSMLAAKIIGALDDQDISVRRAQELTGFAAADFSRVRQAKVQRFTIDRLMAMLVKLNADVEVSIDVHPRRAVASPAPYGLGMLCIAATTIEGYDVLGTNWQIACEMAAERGATMDRSRLRLVGPVHIAETRAQARENVAFCLAKWIDYFTTFNPAAAGADLTADDPISAMIASGRAVIGTPDDAIEQLTRLHERSGGFGCFLQLAHNWADWEHTKHSYELWARYVTPHFRRANVNRDASLRWTRANIDEFMGAAMSAAQQMFVQHADERAAKEAAKTPATGTRGSKRA